MPETLASTATLLLVDDDPSIIQAANRLLSDFGRCRFARSAIDALRLLRNEPVDLMLLDAQMPEMGGLELLALMQKTPELAGIPVVLLTSHRDEATEEAAFAAGAVDYLCKPIRPGVLKARVRTQLRLSRALADVRRLSLTDSLTGLANRRAMQERLEHELVRAARTGSAMSLMMVDVDHFKGFNDHYGHAIGDRALVHVADCLRKAASRASDFSSRWGGEEFVVVLPDTDAQGAVVVAEHLHQSMTELDMPNQASPLGRLSASVGIAGVAARGVIHPVASPLARATDDVEKLLAQADAALYQAKAEGRSRSVLASPEV